MYKNLNESITTDKNKLRVKLLKIALINLKKDVENTPKYNPNKIEENNKIIDIVEHILHFNEENKKEQD